MENLNLHKQKLYLLIGAGVALISLFLPWWNLKFGGGYGLGNVNGLKSWGLLSLAGIAGLVVSAFVLGDKTKPFEGQAKQIAMASCGAMALGELLVLLRIMTASSRGISISKFYSPGFGLFICLLAGAAGLLFLMGIIKVPEKPAAPKS